MDMRVEGGAVVAFGGAAVGGGCGVEIGKLWWRWGGYGSGVVLEMAVCWKRVWCWSCGFMVVLENGGRN